MRFLVFPFLLFLIILSFFVATSSSVTFGKNRENIDYYKNNQKLVIEKNILSLAKDSLNKDYDWLDCQNADKYCEDTEIGKDYFPLYQVTLEQKMQNLKDSENKYITNVWFEPTAKQQGILVVETNNLNQDNKPIIIGMKIDKGIPNLNNFVPNLYIKDQSDSDVEQNINLCSMNSSVIAASGIIQETYENPNFSDYVMPSFEDKTIYVQGTDSVTDNTAVESYFNTNNKIINNTKYKKVINTGDLTIEHDLILAAAKNIVINNGEVDNIYENIDFNYPNFKDVSKNSFISNSGVDKICNGYILITSNVNYNNLTLKNGCNIDIEDGGNLNVNNLSVEQGNSSNIIISINNGEITINKNLTLNDDSILTVENNSNSLFTLKANKIEIDKNAQLIIGPHDLNKVLTNELDIKTCATIIGNVISNIIDIEDSSSLFNFGSTSICNQNLIGNFYTQKLINKIDNTYFCNILDENNQQITSLKWSDISNNTENNIIEGITPIEIKYCDTVDNCFKELKGE